MKETDRKIILEKIASLKEFKFVMKDLVPNEYFNDRDFVVEALKLNPYFFDILPEEMRGDKELILLAAVGVDSFELRFNKKLLDDRTFLLNLLSVNGGLISLVDRDKIDREMLLTAIRQDFYAAAFIPYEMRHDRDLAVAVSKLQGKSLKYLAPEFRDDEEIVYNCVTSYRAFEFASDRLKNNEEFLMRVLEKNPSCLAYAPKKYRTDRQLAEKLMDIHPYVYRYLQGELKYDLNYALKAIRLYPDLYLSVPYDFRKSKAFADGVEKLIEGDAISQEVKDFLRRRLQIDRGEYDLPFKSVVNISLKDEDDGEN